MPTQMALKQKRSGSSHQIRGSSHPLPPLAELGSEESIGFGVVGELHLFGVPFEAGAGAADGDDAEEADFAEGAAVFEAGAGGAAFADGVEEVHVVVAVFDARDFFVRALPVLEEFLSDNVRG